MTGANAWGVEPERQKQWMKQFRAQQKQARAMKRFLR
jgi:hypothetical protein